MSASKHRLRAAFALELAHAQAFDPSLRVLLRFARRPGRCESGATRPCRQFAWCEAEPIRITLAPRLGHQAEARVRGVIRHELGHALMFRRGFPAHTEREADAAAEEAFGAPIYYDADDIQSTQPGGARPRPARLR